jgi:acyl transferase domain-containing protein
MFQPVRALPGRPLRAATLDDWAAPPVTEGNWLCGDSAGVQPGLGQADLGQAQCGQVLRADASETAAMARVTADEDLARALGAPGGLHIAVYAGPRTHVLAGSTAGVRELTRRAAMLKVPVEVLGSTAPLHSPGMARCAAPLRSVLAATSFAPPRRRLVSTITGSLVSPEDDLAWLLATQVTRPVLFAQAMAQAAHAADLIVIAGPDAGLADRAAECGGVPAVAIPASRGVLAPPGVPAGDGRGPRSGRPGAGPGPGRPGPGQVALAEAIAALFVAGAITDLRPYLGPERATAPGGTLASRTVPRTRPGRAPPPPGPARPPRPRAVTAAWGPELRGSSFVRVAL